MDLTGPDPEFKDAPEVYRPSGNVTFTRVIPSDAVTEAASRQEGGGTFASALATESLPPPGQRFLDRFRRRFGREAGPYAAYGYESMAVVLDAIDQRDTGASSLRSSIVDALLKVERLDESVIGPYSFTTEGDTTLCEIQMYKGHVTGTRTLIPQRAFCPTG